MFQRMAPQLCAETAALTRLTELSDSIFGKGLQDHSGCHFLELSEMLCGGSGDNDAAYGTVRTQHGI